MATPPECKIGVAKQWFKHRSFHEAVKTGMIVRLVRSTQYFVLSDRDFKGRDCMSCRPQPIVRSASSSVAMSAGAGASKRMTSPVAGCSNCSMKACSAWR